jgi:Phytanoyl-CoA dioxygenase (PhyH)
MSVITPAMRAAFREQGYLVVPGVLDAGQVAAGQRAVAALLAAQPPEAGRTGPYFLVPWFGTAPHPLLDLYRSAGIARLAAALLRPGLEPGEPHAAQVAATYPPWPHRPGGPHVDGLTPPDPDGRPATFSLLAGVWLTDHREPDTGNLWVWPGTHLRFGAYLAERGAGALARADEMAPGPYPRIELGDPVQVTGAAGSVLLAHYLLGHNTGGHRGGAAPRHAVYYRLHARGHRDRWREAVTSPLAEFR